MTKGLWPTLNFTCNYVSRRIHVMHLQNEQSINDYLSSLCKQKLFKEALRSFDIIEKNSNCHVYPSTYAHLISACLSLRSPQYGRKIHKHILKYTFQPDVILANHILNMYGKCGLIEDARKVFDDMPERNVVSWTSVIAGYSQNGLELEEAVKLYIQMLQSGLMPDQFTFGSIIRACSSMNEVELGKQLHAHVIKMQFGSNLVAQNALIAMHTKFGQINEAHIVFSSIKLKDLVSWSSMIAGFSQLGYELEALTCFREMRCHWAYQPNEFIFGSVFRACGYLGQLEYGRQIHGLSIKFGLGGDVFSGCSLTDMYGKCGLFSYSKTAFNQIENPDVVSWNALISAFAYGGDANEAMLNFSQMRYQELRPDDITIRSLLSAFRDPFTLCQGKQVHSYIMKTGLDLDIPVCNSILSMYANCSDYNDVDKMFNKIQSKADLVSWNVILTACVQHDKAGEVFSLLRMMLLSHNRPDNITLTIVLGACGKIASLVMGDQVYCSAIKTGFTVDVSVINGFIDMYVKCGSIESAKKLFDCMENPDVFSWSCLIVGYAQFGYGEEALNLFMKMRSLGAKPNQVTLVGVLTACSHVGLVEEGWQLFNTMEEEYGVVPTREHYSCVVDLLARAGRINDAEAFINEIPFEPDIVTWKTLLAACKTRNNIEVGKRAAENILQIDPSNSAAHVMLCSIYASTGSWKDVATVRSLMRQNGVKKVPGQSWIEMKDNSHIFSAEDDFHPERGRIYTMLEELLLQMSDAAYVPVEGVMFTGEPCFL
ncbi:pentatricopeptide repeat-containing protein At3g53360, mitochondrial [Olea europaea var. sylvestris]|uniref:pentatricopeptide repeat-containing protein At3g53360, mitochondrial n=1 Tax=Olea europaea var. sylvestris TaxID=158386 RepID=UPI000C1D3F66|nr:pentatricopeptide repeat-containing protein At3g53360, mitochondrial [Olea europaea var. sylvestris]